MGRKIDILSNLVISSGNTESNAFSLSDLGNAEGLAIYTPSTLTGTVRIEVSPDNTNWYTLQSGGDDINLPVSKATCLTKIPVAYLRLKSTSAESSNRTFQVTKLFETSRAV